MRSLALVPQCCRIPAVLLVAFGTPASTEQPPPSTDPWTLQDVRIEASDGIRVLVLHDMEGLSGQDDWRSFAFGTEQYAHGQELLAADLNAVIDGLFAGGATGVHVVDGHGSGNPDPDVRADLLDHRAEQVLRDTAFDPTIDIDIAEPGTYDAVAVVGMHAKTGSGGFASHTYTLGTDLLIDGQSITETELVGLSWGRVDAPLIFASGDDRLERDLVTMPWIQYVTVKRATSAATADLRPVDEARHDLREAAKVAVENLADAKVMKVSHPITATLRAVPPARLDFMDGFPGVDYAEDGVTFVAEDLKQAYDGWAAVVRVAMLGYKDVFIEQLGDDPRNSEALDASDEFLVQRWLDVESGQWEPREDTTPGAGGRYHGDR